MINESQLATMSDSVTSRLDAITAVKNRLDAELAEIAAKPGRTPEYRAEKAAAARSVAVKQIEAELGKLTTTNQCLQSSEKFYKSAEFYLSMQKLTTGNDPAAESMARLSRSQELTRMSPAMLALSAEKAKLTGAWGDLGMIFAENASRGKDGASIPLDDCAIPGRERALQAIRTSNGLSMIGDIMHREAMGMPVSPIDRLTAYREAGRG